MAKDRYSSRQNNRGSKPNPDDRSDNAERIQRNIGYTLKNMEAADEMIAKTDDEKTKKALIEKNERRRQALRECAARCATSRIRVKNSFIN